MGQEKTNVDLNGSSLLERAVSRIGVLGTEIIIVLAPNQDIPPVGAEYEPRIVRDTYSASGPLVGIYTGLSAISSDCGFVMACDMPFVNRDLVHYMMGLAKGYDIVIPRHENLLEPLHAVYSKNCLRSVRELILKAEFKVNKLLDRMRTRYVEESELDRFDPDHLSFFNVNTPEDLLKARRIADRLR